MINRRAVLATAMATGATLAVGTATPAIARPTPRASTTCQILTASGRAGTVEAPGFAVHHLGASWTGSDQAGRIRLRYADGWHSWQPLQATDSGETGRHRSLAYVGPATAYEVEPAAGIETSAWTPSTRSTGRPLALRGTAYAAGPAWRT